MNSAIISAQVITEVEVRTTESGSQVANFRVEVPAIDDRSKPHVMKVTCWNAALIAKVAGIGMNQPVLLKGRVELTTVEQSEGFKTKVAQFVADDVTLLDSVISLNAVTLIGRVGGDPDVKFFESGSVNAKATLAVNRGRNDSPFWFDTICWGKTAQVCADYVRKGKQIAVNGSLFWETWTDRNTGAQRSKPVIKIQSLELLGSARDDRNSAPMEEEYAA